MKKVSEKRRQYLANIQRKRERNRLARKVRALFAHRHGSAPLANENFRRSSSGRLQYKISLPENLSLEENYDEVMEFVEELREYGVRRKMDVYADFKSVRTIGPCGALLLAAELDRWRSVCGFRHRVDPNNWEPSVLRHFDEMGLFDVLEVRNRPRVNVPEGGELSFIKFRSRKRTIGEEATLLAEEIENLAGPIPSKKGLWAGLTEAMTNVGHHAYPEDVSFSTPNLPGQWWMSGSFNSQTRQLTVMFYDQGIGIPHTLPRKHTKEFVARILNRLKLKDDDASRIRAAMELGATRTGKGHRGGGLFRDIRKYTTQIPKGRLRVLSDYGEYIFTLSDKGKPIEKLLTHSKSLGGTLILWEGLVPEDTTI